MKRILTDTCIFQMSPKNKHVASTLPGDTVIFETYDCFSNHIKEESQFFSSVGWDVINPATGPLFIEGAEPGDILKIEILDIKVFDKGVMTTAPGFGVLGSLIPEEKTKIIPIVDDKAVFNDKIQIPIKPMIGVIGTAPEKEEIPTGTPGTHGGNMDCKRIVKGATLYLPVSVTGALLSMGDLHAVMGDGEIVVCGVEISGEITVKINLIRGEEVPLPMLIEGEHIMTIASAKNLDEASNMATENMHKFLMNKLNMNVHEAGMLLSILGNLRICQVVDPLKTARMEFPLWVLEKYGYQMK